MLLAAAACLGLALADGDVAASIERLKSASAAERSAAQTFLARHLSDADLDRVRAAADSGDAETRRRLALAIADDDAKISLAVALAADHGPGAAEVGHTALEERLARWCPGWTRRAIPRADVAEKLAASKPARAIHLDARTKDRRLDVAVDQLTRFAPGAVPIVLDPDLALSDHPRETASSIEGPFARALVELVRLHRAELEGFGFAEDDDGDGRSDRGSDDRSDGGSGPGANEPVRRWIRVRRAVSGPNRTGAEWIEEWCVGVVSDPLPARRAACARALAATGWPGGIAWLERRAFGAKDDAALEGVLLAAGRGQPSPSLARPETVRDLLARLHQEPARADAIARALASVGPIGPKGENLAATVADGLAKLPPREAWSRLVVLEGMRSSSKEAKSAIDALLAAGDTPPPLRFQALRARAATDPASPPAKVEAAPGTLAWAASAGFDREGARLLVDLGVPPPAAPPAASSAATAGGALSTLRLAELEWTLFAGDGAGAGSRLLALEAETDAGGIGLEAVAERVRIWVRQGAEPRLLRAIAAARALPGADADRLERLEILSGGGDDALRARWTERLLKSPAGRADFLVLGALAGRPAADAPRAAIVRALAAGDAAGDAVAAATLAVEGLWSALADDEALAFSRAVAEVAANGPKDLRSRIRMGTWPPRRTPDPVNADEADRTLERSGL